MNTRKISLLDAFVALDDVDDDEIVLPSGNFKSLKEGKTFDVSNSEQMTEAEKVRGQKEAKNDVDLEIVDPDADSEEHLKNNSDYVGQRVLQCNVCNAKRFVDQDKVEQGEDGMYKIIEDEDHHNECPTCHTTDATYKSLGIVAVDKPEAEPAPEAAPVEDEAPVEEEPKVDNDEKSEDEVKFDNDEAAPAEEPAKEEPVEEPVKEEPLPEVSDTEDSDEEEIPYDETDAEDDTVDMEDKTGEVAEETFPWDDTEEEPKKEESLDIPEEDKKDEELNETISDDDLLNLPKHEDEDSETELNFDTVETFFDKCANKDDLDVTVLDRDTDKEIYSGSFMKMPEEILNADICSISVDGKIQISLDDGAEGGVKDILSGVAQVGSVDVVDQDEEPLHEPGDKDEIMEAFGDKKSSHWMVNGDVTITVTGAEPKEKSDLDAAIEAEDPEDELIEDLIRANSMFSTKNYDNDNMWLRHWLSESIKNRENLDYIKENYVPAELLEKFNTVLFETAKKPDLDRIKEFNSALELAKKENKPVIYGYMGTDHHGNDRYFGIDFIVCDNIRDCTNKVMKEYHPSGSVLVAYPEKSFVEQDFADRKALSAAVNECKNNNIPYSVKRSLKEGYRYTLIKEAKEECCSCCEPERESEEHAKEVAKRLKELKKAIENKAVQPTLKEGLVEKLCKKVKVQFDENSFKSFGEYSDFDRALRFICDANDWDIYREEDKDFEGNKKVYIIEGDDVDPDLIKAAIEEFEAEVVAESLNEAKEDVEDFDEKEYRETAEAFVKTFANMSKEQLEEIRDDYNFAEKAPEDDVEQMICDALNSEIAKRDKAVKEAINEDEETFTDETISDPVSDPVDNAVMPEERPSAVESSARDVMAAYQNANKWLDSVKEAIYTDMNCPFFSSFVHNLAHSMPARFDKFGDILHTINMEIPYPETSELETKPTNIVGAFDVIFSVLDSIKAALNSFIKVTDEDQHGMSCAAEALLNDIEGEYPFFFRLQAKAAECGDDTVTFDKFVGQYVEHKGDLLESLNESKADREAKLSKITDEEIIKKLNDSKDVHHPENSELEFEAWYEDVAGDIYADVLGDFSGARLTPEQGEEFDKVIDRVKEVARDLITKKDESLTEAKKDDAIDKVMDRAEKIEMHTELIQDAVDSVSNITDAIKEFEDSDVKNKEEIISKLHHVKGQNLKDIDELEKISPLLPGMGELADEPEVKPEPEVEEEPVEELPDDIPVEGDIKVEPEAEPATEDFDEKKFENFINEYLDNNVEETKLFEATSGSIDEDGKIVIEGLMYTGSSDEGEKTSYTLTPIKNLDESKETEPVKESYTVTTEGSDINLTYIK